MIQNNHSRNYTVYDHNELKKDILNLINGEERGIGLRK